MRERKVMFSDAGWELVQREASAHGISAAQLVREASMAYAVWLLARRGGDETSAAIESIIARLRED